MKKLPGYVLAMMCTLFTACTLLDTASNKGLYGLTVEYRDNPVGIDTPCPRLSWKLSPSGKNVRQTSYRVRVASSKEKLVNGMADLWDSGVVVADQSVNVEYAGKSLATSQRCWWDVEVRDSEARVRRSLPALWVMGVMRPQDWRAKWIGANPATLETYDMHGAKWIWAGDAAKLEEADAGPRFFKNNFTVPEGLLSKEPFGYTLLESSIRRPGKDAEKGKPVVLAVTADDTWTVYLNGKVAARTWGHLNDWKWMKFIDVSPLLHTGRNEIVVQVENSTKGPTGLLFSLILPDGRSIVSDGSWESSAATRPRGWNGDSAKLQKTAWKRAVIAGPVDCAPWGKIERTIQRESPAFEKTFRTEKPVVQATLHVTGVGFYEASLDGARIGNKVLDPAPTKYDKRVLYSTYDLTRQLAAPGRHTLRMLIGRGWYDVRSVASWNFDNAPWRDLPAGYAQLELLYADGAKETVCTDASWRQVTSPVVYDDIREGELIQSESRKSLDLPARVVPGPSGKLCAEMQPGASIMRTIKPVSVTKLSNGKWFVDFGQNIAGWVRLDIEGQKKGDIITIQYGEKKNQDGSLSLNGTDQHFRYTYSFFYLPGGWFQRDRFLCSGFPKETYEPRFTYNGFQYVEIGGLNHAPTAETIKACVVHTAFTPAGSFTCSNPLLNKIQNIFLWSYRGNYADGYPTDCPHREKNGWTGDAALASEMGQYNFHNVSAYEKWIRDLMDEQQDDGSLPGIVPTSGWGYKWGSGPAWDCSLTIIPWMLYTYNADVRILQEVYPSWLKYMNSISGRAKDNIVSHGLGDWCPARRDLTPVSVTSTGYYYLDCLIVSRAAELLGKKEDARKFSELAAAIKDSFNKKMAKEDGTYSTGSQCAQGCVLHQGLVTDALRAKAESKLVECVKASNGNLDFGILGSKYVFRSLSDAGRTDLAYDMATKTNHPSFGEWIGKGATTAWEDWFNGSSRNHVMFGDISAWMYQVLAGIRLDDSVSPVAKCVDPAAVGFKRFLIAPEPVRDLTWVNASHESPYGLIRSEWKKEGTRFTLTVEIPPNSEATICLPVGAKDVQVPAGVSSRPARKGCATYQVGSGIYTFCAVL